MSDNGDVVEVTAPIELAIVGDRLHATVISGSSRRTYALTFGRAKNATLLAWVMLNAERLGSANVCPFPKKADAR